MTTNRDDPEDARRRAEPDEVSAGAPRTGQVDEVDEVDEQSAQSFPASDPPSWSAWTISGSPDPGPDAEPA